MALYKNERVNRKLYCDKRLHMGILELTMILLLDPNGFTLEPLYTNQYPMRVLKINVPFILRLHLNHPANSNILGMIDNNYSSNNNSNNNNNNTNNNNNSNNNNTNNNRNNNINKSIRYSHSGTKIESPRRRSPPNKQIHCCY